MAQINLPGLDGERSHRRAPLQMRDCRRAAVKRDDSAAALGGGYREIAHAATEIQHPAL